MAAIKRKGNIIPEFNHLKNLIFLLITLGIVLIMTYLKINKLIKSVNDLFIFIYYRFLEILILSVCKEKDYNLTFFEKFLGN